MAFIAASAMKMASVLRSAAIGMLALGGNGTVVDDLDADVADALPDDVSENVWTSSPLVDMPAEDDNADDEASTLAASTAPPVKRRRVSGPSGRQRCVCGCKQIAGTRRVSIVAATRERQLFILGLSRRRQKLLDDGLRELYRQRHPDVAADAAVPVSALAELRIADHHYRTASYVSEPLLGNAGAAGDGTVPAPAPGGRSAGLQLPSHRWIWSNVATKEGSLMRAAPDTVRTPVRSRFASVLDELAASTSLTEEQDELVAEAQRQLELAEARDAAQERELRQLRSDVDKERRSSLIPVWIRYRRSCWSPALRLERVSDNDALCRELFGFGGSVIQELHDMINVTGAFSSLKLYSAAAFRSAVSAEMITSDDVVNLADDAVDNTADEGADAAPNDDDDDVAVSDDAASVVDNDIDTGAGTGLIPAAATLLRSVVKRLPMTTAVHVPRKSDAGGRSATLNSLNMLAFTLYILRTNATFAHAGWVWGMSPKSSSSVFVSVLGLLASFLVLEFAPWTAERARLNTPMSTEKQLGVTVAAFAIDSMESYAPRPSSRILNGRFFSLYKNRATYKYLILVSLMGVTLHVSEAYVGSSGDDAILMKEWPNICKYLAPGSVLLLDKGYNSKTLGPLAQSARIELQVPPRRESKKSQFAPGQVAATRAIAKQRIVVENVIGDTSALFPWIRRSHHITSMDVVSNATRVAFLLHNLKPRMTSASVASATKQAGTASQGSAAEVSDGSGMAPMSWFGDQSECVF
jgi:hypothetical protein